ncbi:Uncharacterized protein FKW44_001351, partial [Caligus rogercresseyi]
FGGSGDVSVWIKQVDIAKDLLGLDDLSRIIPLFLEGNAFAVYDQLSEEGKKDEAVIKQALLNAFSMSKFEAFSELCTKKWEPGVSVDVHLAQVRSLVNLVGKGGMDEVVKVAFVTSLPSGVSSQLQATPKIESMSMAEVAGVARGLLAQSSPQIMKDCTI